MEGGHHDQAGTGAAKGPKEVWVRGFGNEGGIAVGEDDVERDDGVGAESPVPRGVAEPTEGAVSANADGGAGAVGKSGKRVSKII